MSEYLFAYGTLRPGFAPAGVAAVVARMCEVAGGTVPGVLYDLGSYPGAVVDQASARRIRGTVFRLPEDDGVLRELDAYEEYYPESPHTSQFIRRRHPVQLLTGDVLDCWVYEYNRGLDNAVVVESGEYRPLRDRT